MRQHSVVVRVNLRESAVKYYSLMVINRRPTQTNADLLSGQPAEKELHVLRAKKYYREATVRVIPRMSACPMKSLLHLFHRGG